MEACPTGALIFGDVNDPNSEISKVIARSKDKLEDLHSEYGLGPNVRYIGLPKRFIAGEVVFKDRKDECAEGVKVTLLGKGKKEVKSVLTDNYGEFEFEGLDADKQFTVLVEHAGYTAKKIKTTTKIDTYMGEIVLGKAKI